MASKVQLTGGAFQDSEGNLLALGYLTMRLSQDSSVGTSQICSGIEITIQLNSSGSVVASQFVWGNDQLSPANSFYTVTGFTAAGQPAWGPNNQQVVGDGGTFDVGTWVPNQVISWVPGIQRPELEVNGTPNVQQNLLNFVDSGTVTWTDNEDGSVSAEAGGGSIVDRAVWSGAEYSQVHDTNVGPGGFNDQVFAYRMTVAIGFTIRQITQRNFNTVVGSFTCAIYSADGTTKIADAGANAFDANIGGDQTVVITPVVIPAGIYYFAYGCTDSSKQYRYGMAISDPTVYNINSAQFFVRSANSLTAGAMPSSLGALTDSGLSGWPSFLLQP